MSVIEKITVSLTSEMISEIKAAIDAGEFADESDAVRAALRQWQRSRKVIVLNDDELRRMVADGLASGETVDGETALRQLRAKYEAMAVERTR